MSVNDMELKVELNIEKSPEKTRKEVIKDMIGFLNEQRREYSGLHCTLSVVLK
jgi:hypothetical protein